jgi:hypothetical protein
MPGGERPSLRASTRRASNLTSAGRFRRLVESVPECDEAGPGGPPRAFRMSRSDDYQVPPLGQAPLPAVAHVRVTAPVAGAFVIVNVFPEDEVATMP